VGLDPTMSRSDQYWFLHLFKLSKTFSLLSYWLTIWVTASLQRECNKQLINRKNTINTIYVDEMFEHRHASNIIDNKRHPYLKFSTISKPFRREAFFNISSLAFCILWGSMKILISGNFTTFSLSWTSFNFLFFAAMLEACYHRKPASI